jgi:hypothetical protein
MNNSNCLYCGDWLDNPEKIKRSAERSDCCEDCASVVKDLEGFDPRPIKFNCTLCGRKWTGLGSRAICTCQCGASPLYRVKKADDEIVWATAD